MSCPGAVKLHVDAANGTSQTNTATDTDAVSISGLNAVPKSASSIQLKWKTIAGVDTYRIYVYDVAKKAYKEKGRTQTGAYQVRGLAKSGNEYKIAVRGYSADQGRIVAVTPLATITSKTLPGSPKLSELGAEALQTHI
ncbi:MAG: fibronectin type III domain-containing protein [Coprococcus sp.]